MADHSRLIVDHILFTLIFIPWKFIDWTKFFNHNIYLDGKIIHAIFFKENSTVSIHFGSHLEFIFGILLWLIYFDITYLCHFYYDLKFQLSDTMCVVLSFLLSNSTMRSIAFQLEQRQNIFLSMLGIQGTIGNISLLLGSQDLSKKDKIYFFKLLSAFHWLVYYKKADNYQDLQELARTEFLEKELVEYLESSSTVGHRDIVLKLFIDKVKVLFDDTNVLKLNFIEQAEKLRGAAGGRLNGYANYELPYLYDFCGSILRHAFLILIPFNIWNEIEVTTASLVAAWFLYTSLAAFFVLMGALYNDWIGDGIGQINPDRLLAETQATMNNFFFGFSSPEEDSEKTTGFSVSGIFDFKTFVI